MEEPNFNNVTFKDNLAVDKRYLKGFLAKMNLMVMINLEWSENDKTKVINVISRSYGNVMNWAASLLENQDPCLFNYDTFITWMKSFMMITLLPSSFIANQKLKIIKQKRLGDFETYILEFIRYALTYNCEFLFR